MTEIAKFNAGLLEFLHRSPTPFHAVANMVDQLDAAGFVPLDEGESWALQPGGRYYVVHNGSSLVAMVLGRSGPEQDRKSTRLNSSHVAISYAVFCLKKKTRQNQTQ